MYLKRSFNKKTGRTYLSIAQKYRDPLKKTSTDRTIKSLGYLDELEKKFDDPITHFKEVARKLTLMEDGEKKVTLSFDMDEQLVSNTDTRRNFGYAAILKIYRELELNRFFNNKARHENFQFNTNSIMNLLVISSILSPGPKKKAFEEKGRYFERFNFSLEDIYRSLSHFAKIAKEAQWHINEQITKKHGRDLKAVYYNMTNFHFKFCKEGYFRKKGTRKEIRPNPIVQMGLLADADGIPIAFEHLPGNKPDKETFRFLIEEMKRNYDKGKIIVVADKEFITEDNILYLTGGNDKNGYVFNFSIRSEAADFKKYVLDGSGYVDENGKATGAGAAYKAKSRVVLREINVTGENGKLEKRTVYEKQVVFYDKKYAEREKADREKAVAKAVNIVSNPSTAFDYKKLTEEELYDGYYAIVTSELDMDIKDIIDICRGLWEIGETFKVAKGDPEVYPNNLQREDCINAHMLSCFISLVIIRLLHKKIGRLYSAEKIIECLNQITCSLEQENIYLFDYRTDISDLIGTAVGIDFTHKRLRLSDIKKSLVI